MIKIWSNVHCSFAALHLVNQLKKLGHEASIIQEWDKNDESLYILYQVSNKSGLPKNFILQQTEPWNSHWFNEHYLNETIKNAIAVWDYSEENQKHYEHEKKCIVTPGINMQSHHPKTIMSLFYGHIDGSPRRAEIIEKLKSMAHLEVVTNTCGPEMWKILKSTAEVINIHYHEDSPLELYRIYESISHGCAVYLYDEHKFFTGAADNLEEIAHGLKLAGI